MFAPAVFGINNSGLNLAVELVILFLVVIWVALLYWTYSDAKRRIADPLLVGCAFAASLFPFVGTVVYSIVRPPEFLDDVRERELEMQAAEARLAQVGFHLCPHCDYEVERDYLRCPNCMRKLKDPCRNCGKPLDPAWKLCPYCEAEVGAVPAPRRVRRRREGVPPAEPPSGRDTIRDPIRDPMRETVVGEREPARDPYPGDRDPTIARNPARQGRPAAPETAAKKRPS